MIIIVCGGRTFTDVDYVHNRLSQLHKKLRFTHVIHGGATGVDTYADTWAGMNRVQPVICPALWGWHGTAAGPIRNRAMLALGAQRLVHFPGGKGTADMVAAAKAAGLRCIKG